MTTPRSRARCSRVAGSRDVPALLEQRVPEGEARPLAHLQVGPVGTVGQCEGLEGRGREPVDVEVREQVRGDLVPQVVGMFLGHGRVQRRPVHQFERPRPHPDRHITCGRHGRAAPRPPAGRHGRRGTRCLRRPRSRNSWLCSSCLLSTEGATGPRPVRPTSAWSVIWPGQPYRSVAVRTATLIRQSSRAPMASGTRPTDGERPPSAPEQSTDHDQRHSDDDPHGPACR